MRIVQTKTAVLFFILQFCAACTNPGKPLGADQSRWLLVDNFESDRALEDWHNIDAQNETDPYVPNAQITEIRRDAASGNHYMLRKPAADGVVGNRKAIGFSPLPVQIDVGEIYTIYTRINVEY